MAGGYTAHREPGRSSRAMASMSLRDSPGSANPRRRMARQRQIAQLVSTCCCSAPVARLPLEPARRDSPKPLRMLPVRKSGKVPFHPPSNPSVAHGYNYSHARGWAAPSQTLPTVGFPTSVWISAMPLILKFLNFAFRSTKLPVRDGRVPWLYRRPCCKLRTKRPSGTILRPRHERKLVFTETRHRPGQGLAS